MASIREVSSFAEDLLCPVCLSLFRDPRLLECGHSFCAPCLEACVPMGQRRGLCPACRLPFAPRRVAVNRALRSLADKARLLKLDEGPPAGAGAGWYFCEEHEEPLKLFCSQDEAPVCVICRDLPQHRGHDFLPVKNAVQEYQDQLKASLEPLEEGLKRLIRNQCRQQENILELKSCAESLSDHVSGEFEKMHHLLTVRELGLKEALEQQRQKNLAQMEDKLQEFNWKVATWTETLSQDAKELMERVRQGQGPQGKEAEKTEQVEVEEEVRTSDEDMDESEKEQEGEEEEEEEEEAEEEEEEEEEEEVVEQEAKEEEDDEVVPVDLNIGEFKGPLQFYAWKELLATVHPAPACIILDCRSAHPSLVLIEEATGVKFSPGRRFWRRKPERFTASPCVVGQEGFTSGRLYWEVRVGDSIDWVVGVARRSVKRKRRLSFRPREGVWAVERRGEQYWALTEPQTLLCVGGRLEKVGVYLDFEGGQLSFYNSTCLSHLHTFQEAFHEELLPFLSTHSSKPLSMWDLEL
ncbi:nuclear factor 7, ovary isoform X2 [Alligator mississippiensis]|uniref:nuclear factor 7, ovary isoform X2 n=1 Tax=Alligator mississippiensis TaxID=8496 RepID=UPI00090701A2|nr:nuclear factor 7, ovary isoform X2 [Alligator mississippiensis]